jgi:homoserine kinase
MQAQIEKVVPRKEFLALPRKESFEVRVPASIANLGSGFETLAVAVQLYVILRVKRLPGNGELHFRCDLGADVQNDIERAYRYLAGEDARRLPSLSLEARSEIARHAGLGRRAALVVAGLRLYEAVAGAVPTQRLLQAALALGCRPENAAASLLGGLTLSCSLPDGSVHATKYPWPEALGLVVLTPSLSRASDEAAAQLPNSVSRADLVFNLQRVALLLQSLRSGDFSLLKYALEDRVHQPYRERGVPGLAEALNLKHQDLLGICLGGSGPSIVAMAECNLWEIGDLLAAIYQRSRIDYQLRILDAHQEVSARPEVFRAGLLCCS